jgi:hypothetical protein
MFSTRTSPLPVRLLLVFLARLLFCSKNFLLIVEQTDLEPLQEEGADEEGGDPMDEDEGRPVRAVCAAWISVLSSLH